MKILIQDLESKIGYKIKRNFKAIGLDTAQISGLVFLKTDNIHLHIDYILLNFKTKNHKEIYHSMVKTFEKVFDPEYFVVIESVFVGFSRAGSVELAKYGALGISECIKKDMEYETISATSARAKFKINTMKYGKGKSKQAVRDWINTLGIDFTDDNLSDAFVLGLLGLIEGMDFRSQSDIKKGIKAKKKTVKKSAKRH